MRDVQKILDALGSPIRREILWLIWDRERPAGEISNAFDVTAATISEHLAVLRNAGLVTVRSAGTFRYYRAAQDVLHGLQALLLDEGGSRWVPADDLPERANATARTSLVVVASADVPLDRPTTFRGFTDPVLFSRWLGVPVTLDRDGHFGCTLEWGTTVRGRYAEVCPPALIAMEWDFADDNVPIPGGERDAYVRFFESDAGCRVEVLQLVADELQARFMEAAWTMVLGRLRQGLVAAAAVDAPESSRRPRRRKLSRPH